MLRWDSLMKTIHIYTKTYLIFAILFSCYCVKASEISSSNGQWVHSGQLQPGMKILTADNQFLTIHKAWVKRKDTATTYNVEVENNHTYFVGDQKIWAHNTTDCDNPGLIKRAWQWVFGKPKQAALPRTTVNYNDPVVIEAEKAVGNAMRNFAKKHPHHKHNTYTSMGDDGVIEVEINMGVKTGVSGTDSFARFQSELLEAAEKFNVRIKLYTRDGDTAISRLFIRAPEGPVNPQGGGDIYR